MEARSLMDLLELYIAGVVIASCVFGWASVAMLLDDNKAGGVLAGWVVCSLLWPWSTFNVIVSFVRRLRE